MRTPDEKAAHREASKQSGISLAKGMRDLIALKVSEAPDRVFWWMGFFTTLAGYMGASIGRDAHFIASKTADAVGQEIERRTQEGKL